MQLIISPSNVQKWISDFKLPSLINIKEVRFDAAASNIARVILKVHAGISFLAVEVDAGIDVTVDSGVLRLTVSDAKVSGISMRELIETVVLDKLPMLKVAGQGIYEYPMPYPFISLKSITVVDGKLNVEGDANFKEAADFFTAQAALLPVTGGKILK